jgi:hypothetical protein
MALQIVMTSEMVASEGAGKKLTFRMRCFTEGAPTGPTDPAVIDAVRSTFVEGDLSDPVLRQAVLDGMAEKFQTDIDEFKENDVIKAWLVSNGIPIIVAALEG